MWARGAAIEQRRRRVREEALRHELVRLDRGVDVGLVDADGDAHVHLLRALPDCAADLEEVGALEGLEAEVVEAAAAAAGSSGARPCCSTLPQPPPVHALVVTLVVDRGVEARGVLLDDLVHVLGDESGGEAGLERATRKREEERRVGRASERGRKRPSPSGGGS